jgi:hypothetical protein
MLITDFTYAQTPGKYIMRLHNNNEEQRNITKSSTEQRNAARSSLFTSDPKLSSRGN